MPKLYLLSLALIAGICTANAQDGRLNKGNALLPSISYAAQAPGGDLVDRFGPNFNVGLSLDYLTSEKNWIFGLTGQYLFGQDVKTDVLAGLRTPEGSIIGNDRSYVDIQLKERGFYAGLHIGKLVSFSSLNPRSGFRFTVGAGLLQHKIRIQDDPLTGVPQLSDTYKKGYDRLTNGLALQEFVGYQLLSNNRRINFFAGFEFTQAFTRSRRDFDFDTRQKDDADRLDLLFGFRLGWILPFYFGQAADEVYY